jgi:hypothetical protein
MFGKTICSTSRILVGDLGPFCDFLRRNRDERDLAEFGRTELGLVVLEIRREGFRRGRIDGPGLGGPELDIFDRTLLVLKPAECLDHRLRRLQPGGNRARNLSPQRNASLIGDVTGFGKAELPDHGLKALRIERAANALEVWIVEDHAHGFRIGLSKPEPPRVFVKRSLRDRLLQHLPVDPERPRLVRRQRSAELPPNLLQPIGINLPEFVERNLGMPDLGQRRLPESPENIGNAPDAEADDQYPHHGGHDCLAEPV